MQIEVKYLENLKLSAHFDDFKVLTDQPIRYKGDGTAPGPFDYFLASSVLCAAYFVKVYCKARDISTEDILVKQDNIVDPENRYQQTFKIQVEIPASISEKDREGIIRSIDRCTVKKTIQQGVEFIIEAKTVLDKEENSVFTEFLSKKSSTFITGKDSSLEDTILNMTKILEDLGIKIEISSWRNPVPNVWSVHLRDADCPMNFSNGKGKTKESALCSALGEFLERLATNYFYSDYYLGEKISESDFVHYPNEKWFKIDDMDILPTGMMDDLLNESYNPDGELSPQHLIDTNSGNVERGICTLPYKRSSDDKTVYIPVSLIGNLFVSNGMSAGNNVIEAQVQALSEIFERAIKNKIILEEITLPDVPKSKIESYPELLEGINELERRGYPIVVKDASLGGNFPVLCVTLMNPHNGGVFPSFGAHPKFEIALERCLTELLQGRSFEGLNDIFPPTFNSMAVQEPNNIVDHFIDSTGIISWKFFSDIPDYEFSEWNCDGNTQEEHDYLMGILKELGKEVYISNFESLGVSACRILVPNFSEIYPVEDLYWDNNNVSLLYRKKILNIHQLSTTEKIELVDLLEENGHDNFMPVSELIGISFDENSNWGELVIGELKGLIHLSLKNYEDAKEYVELFFTFNDHNMERRKYYQLVNILLDIQIDPDLNFENYQQNLERMYGPDLLKIGRQTISGEIQFFGLEKTNLQLKSLDRHLDLLKSYEKIQKVRGNTR